MRAPSQALIAGFSIAVLAGCGLFGKGPATPERETLNAALVFTARGIVEADSFCASVARSLMLAGKLGEAERLAGTCAKSHRSVLDALEAADRALEAGDQTRVACAVSKGAGSVEKLLGIGAQWGHPAPAKLVDVVKWTRPIAALAGGGCL